MPLAHHLIFGAYAQWLPNDPRGSFSTLVRSLDLYRAAGKTTKSRTRRPLTPDTLHAAQRALRYPPVTFTRDQRDAIAAGFQTAITRSRFTLHACSILPFHVHAVVKAHTYPIEQVMNQLKGEATKALNNAKLHPFQNTFLPSGKRHSPWAEDGWDVDLDTPADITRSTKYVEDNPAKEGLPPQHWPFIIPYPAPTPAPRYQA
jgi:REP element-mobilizing transposase RayT